MKKGLSTSLKQALFEFDRQSNQHGRYMKFLLKGFSLKLEL